MVKRRIHIVVAVMIAMIALTGCALFVVGETKQSAVIERSQRTSQGVVYLYKEALDSNNVQAATDLMVHSSGRRLLAVERYEIQDDVERWRRLMDGKPITEMTTDTLTATAHKIHVIMDYIKHFEFSAVRMEEGWYVSSIQPVTAKR